MTDLQAVFYSYPMPPLTHTSFRTPEPSYDLQSTLWTPGQQSHQQYFHHLNLIHRLQIGGTCVSTGLSLLTGDEPMTIRNQINTQDPTSWSSYLQRYGYKLAYCNSDFRKLKHYVNDLLALDDLFTISTYSPSRPQEIGSDPDAQGWICSSHFVILHRSMVYDTTLKTPVRLDDYCDLDRYVKRLFRVVPADHPRGL